MTWKGTTTESIFHGGKKSKKISRCKIHRVGKMWNNFKVICIKRNCKDCSLNEGKVGRESSWKSTDAAFVGHFFSMQEEIHLVTLFCKIHPSLWYLWQHIVWVSHLQCVSIISLLSKTWPLSFISIGFNSKIFSGDESLCFHWNDWHLVSRLNNGIYILFIAIIEEKKVLSMLFSHFRIACEIVVW